MLRIIVLLFWSLITLNPFCTLATKTYTNIGDNVIIYSEYYPNPNAKFKGTIIFEAGSGLTTREWTDAEHFFKCVQQHGSLFMYDRNGLGNSPADLSTSTVNPITAKFINKKLIRLLQENKLTPPYILVGHSYGGLYVGYFSRKYPDLVKGVLMIDPLPPVFTWAPGMLNEPMIEKFKKIPTKKMYSKRSGKVV